MCWLTVQWDFISVSDLGRIQKNLNQPWKQQQLAPPWQILWSYWLSMLCWMMVQAPLQKGGKTWCNAVLCSACSSPARQASACDRFWGCGAVCLLDNSHISSHLLGAIPSSEGGSDKVLWPSFLFAKKKKKKLAFIFSSARKCLTAPDFCASPDFIVCWLWCRKGRATGEKCWLRCAGIKSRWR